MALFREKKDEKQKKRRGHEEKWETRMRPSKVYHDARSASPLQPMERFSLFPFEKRKLSSLPILLSHALDVRFSSFYRQNMNENTPQKNRC